MTTETNGSAIIRCPNKISQDAPGTRMEQDIFFAILLTTMSLTYNYVVVFLETHGLLHVELGQVPNE